MIQEKELRLGNLIYKYGIDCVGDNHYIDCSDGEIIKVDLEVLKNIQDFNVKTDYYYTDGIKLTKDILLKCGFEYVNPHGYRMKRGCFMKDDLEYSGYFFRWNGQTLAGIHYLHQLQNLYFALTNQELTINL